MTGKPGFILALWLAAAGSCSGDEHVAVSGLISYPAVREPNMESHAVHMLLLEQLALLY